MDRVVGLVRIGGMALGAVDADGGVEAAAAADLDDVAQGIGVGGLADEAEVGDVAVGLHPVEHADGAVGGRALLVAGDEQADGAVQFVDMRGRRGDEGRDAALHVAGTAADQKSVADLAGEGVGSPAGRARGDDVRVSGEAEMRRTGAAAGEQVGGGAEREVVDGETEIGEHGAEHG